MKRSALSLLLLVLCGLPSIAQTWPARPVTMVVPLAAGGGSDVLARLLAPRLSEVLGQTVIVENVGGAGGMIGAARVAKADPDGYLFLLGTSGTQALNQSVYKEPLYNAANDFQPVTMIFDMPLVLTTRKDFPASNLKEFIAYVRANQSKMQYGSSGAGGTGHLACELLNAKIDAKVTHIPYRGGGPAMQDQIAGRIDYQCPLANIALPLIESGQIKAIAVMSKNRSPLFPDLPSVHEQGVADFEATAWNGFFLPKRTPAPIAEKLRQASIEMMNTPAIAKRFQELGATLTPQESRTPEFLQAYVETEIAKWAATIKAAQIQQQ